MRIRPLLVASLLLAGSALAKFAYPQLTPVDRLVKSAAAYLAAHPNEAEAHYTLARVHYLAFSKKHDQIPAWNQVEGAKVELPGAGLLHQLGEREDGDQRMAGYNSDQLLQHAMHAQREFREAVRLEPENALYQLGLASLLDELQVWVQTAHLLRTPVDFKDPTVAEVRAAYTRAFSLGIAKDRALAHLPLHGIADIVSNEAATALVRLAKQDPASMTADDRKTLEEAQAALEKFSLLKTGPITPMVLSMQPVRHLDELLAPETTVDFDLRGYGPREQWPWVKPELGFLVWDPLGQGRICSARDLFGSYSFQIFRRTGYDALAALDDNGDGQLSGDELAGLRVWFDRNGDGVSTADEVVSLDALGITAISTNATAKDGIHPMNPAGLTLRNGQTLPTWDWIVSPRERRAAGHGE